MTGQRRDLNREKFKFENLISIFNNPESNASRNLKYLSYAMDVRSKLKGFHPSSVMECLTRGRSDIVVIKRGFGKNAIFAIHNMTENKINFLLNDKELTGSFENNINMKDNLSSDKYNSKNISLEPFQVVWLSALI